MISVFKFFGKLPLTSLRLIGLIFSWCFWFSSKRYRLRFKKNWEVAKVYGGGKMVDANFFTAIGRAGSLIFELPKIWCSENVVHSVDINGFSEIEKLLNRGRGLICLSPHLGSFELVPKVFSTTTPISILYKPSKNARLDRILRELRPTRNITMVEPDFSGVKKLLIALKKGEIVGLLPDQVPPLDYGVTKLFFGKPAYTMTLAAKLMLKTNSPVVWTYVNYKKNGWRVNIKSWNYENLSKKNICQITKEINKKIEELVLEEPESYLWGYDRYKTPKKLSNRIKK